METYEAASDDFCAMIKEAALAGGLRCNDAATSGISNELAYLVADWRSASAAKALSGWAIRAIQAEEFEAVGFDPDVGQDWTT